MRCTFKPNNDDVNVVKLSYITLFILFELFSSSLTYSRIWNRTLYFVHRGSLFEFHVLCFFRMSQLPLFPSQLSKFVFIFALARYWTHNFLSHVTGLLRRAILPLDHVEEGRDVERPKFNEYENKVEDNSPNNVHSGNSQNTTSHKYEDNSLKNVV